MGYTGAQRRAASSKGIENQPFPVKGLDMARARGRSAKITKLGEAQKVNPIPRERDNTMDVERRVLERRSRRHKAAADQSVPGKVVTAPPHSESAMPS